MYRRILFFCAITFFAFSGISFAQTLETKIDGTLLEVRVSRGVEDVISRQTFISKTPFGDPTRRSLRDFNTYINTLSFVYKDPAPVPLNTPNLQLGSLPLEEKLYVNTALYTRTGQVFWIDQGGGGKTVTLSTEARFAINLNPLVVSGNNLSVSGVIDTRIHFNDFNKFKFTYYITDAGDINNPITELHTRPVRIEPNGTFGIKDFGINILNDTKIYTVVLKVVSPNNTVDTSLVQKFSKEKGFILPVTTEEGRSAFDAQTYKLLAPLPGLSLIRDTDLCLEYKASIAAQGGNTDDIVCDINDFLNFLMKMLIAISAVVLIIRIILAGFSYMTTDIPFLKSSSKGQITTALGGLALALSAWILLNTINPRLVSGSVELEGVEFAVEEFSEIDAPTFQRLTGQSIKPKKEYLAMVEKEAQAQGIDACIVKATITIESAWKPNLIGCDENVRSSTVPSRRAFIESGIKLDGTKFTEKSVEAKLFNNCPKQINPSVPGYGLDWRFSKGGGLMQMTVFPNGYKTPAWFAGVKEGGTYWQSRNIPYKDFNNLIVPENNIKRGVALLKSNLASCGGNIEQAYRKYQTGDCDTRGDVVNKTVREKMTEYTVCKSGAPQYSSL